MIAKSYANSLPPVQRVAGLERARDWRIAHGLPVRERPEVDGIQPVVESQPIPGRKPGSQPPTPSAESAARAAAISVPICHSKASMEMGVPPPALASRKEASCSAASSAAGQHG